MAANKFATLIHRNSNRLTLILVYAVLEWTLIFFILLNSLFSFFILRFADFFGLIRPCLLCSRLDRFFHSSSSSSSTSPSYPHLFCHDHALQLSGFRFCPTHRKFADSAYFCEDCSSSPDLPKDFLQLCSCCGATVENRDSHPCPPINPDSEVLGFIDDGIPIGEEIPFGVEIPVEHIRFHIGCQEDNVGSVNSQERSSMGEEETDEKPPSEGEKMKEEDNRWNQTAPEAPVEKDEEVNEGGDDNDAEQEFSCFISSFDCNKEPVPAKEEENGADLVMEVEISQKSSVAALSTDKPTEAAQKHLEFYIDGQDCHLIPIEFFRPGEEVREISDSNGDVILDFGAEADIAAGKGEFSEETVAFVPQYESKPEADEAVPGSSANDLEEMEKDEEADAEVSIGTEIPDHEQIDADASHEITPEDYDDDREQAEEETLEFRTLTLETETPFINISLQGDEEKLPETPGSSSDSLHSPLHIQFHLDRRESGAEDYLDAELESPDGNLTMDKLKAALQGERKALNALYAELEEERSASAVAANETMAMINRLQEEKAAMQMEALQYQRMMEEQSEYDQEALQLMNELLVKREKEKAELEKELELYRKRVEDYESMENRRMLRRRRRRDSSVDSYENGYSDEHENEGMGEKSNSDEENGMSERKRTPVDEVVCMEEWLGDLEGEREWIIGRLKDLEEKLSDLNEEEDDVTREGNGHVWENRRLCAKERNGRHKVLKSKRLLPLFDATEAEAEAEMENGKHEGENGIEEGIEELYERIEGLEADREFIRHCLGSLRKGDKGVNLLHQILHHLTLLRNLDHPLVNPGAGW